MIHVHCAILQIAIPFFGDLLGFIGALGTGPTTFWLPPLIWLFIMPDSRRLTSVRTSFGLASTILPTHSRRPVSSTRAHPAQCGQQAAAACRGKPKHALMNTQSMHGWFAQAHPNLRCHCSWSHLQHSVVIS